MSTFVSVGNGTQSFSRLLKEVKRIAHLLPQPVVVQCGHTDAKVCEGLQVFTFVDVATFKKLLSESDVFICHGGGGSVFTALGLGKKPVVVPRQDTYREIVDDHQMIFARELARQGKIILVEDVAQLLSASTQDASNYLYNEVREMKPDPVDKIAAATARYISAPSDKFCLVTPPGGHLTELMHLSRIFQNHPHFYVLNMPIVETEATAGKLHYVTLSERDWRFLINLWEAWVMLRKEKPKVILTTGGVFSVAFGIVGKLLGIPTIFIETWAKVERPSLAGKIMYHIADEFFYQWPQLNKFFPKGQFVGLLY